MAHGHGRIHEGESESYMTASGRSGRPLSPQALHILHRQQSSDHTTTPVHCFRFGGAFIPGIGPEDRAEFRCENNRRSEGFRRSMQDILSDCKFVFAPVGSSEARKARGKLPKMMTWQPENPLKQLWRR